MSDKKIISLAEADAPGREVLRAASDLLNAVMRQYPRAAPDLMAGVTIRITSRAGALLEISGGSAPSNSTPTIIPGGIH